MQKPKGEVFIAIGSVLMIIGSIIGILFGLLLTVAGGWVWSILGAMDGIDEVAGVGGVLMAAGAIIGIVVIIIAVLTLVFSIMSFNRHLIK